MLLPFLWPVQVLDISRTGVLLESPRSPALGSRGTLQLTLAGAALTAEVEVRRVSPASTDMTDMDGCFQVAVGFVAISPEARQVIERCTNV